MSFKIELGSQVRCKITGFCGVVVGRYEYLHGCRRYGVQTKELKDGKPQDSVGFDEDALEVIEQAEPHKVKDTGGPQPEPQRRAEPTR